MTRALILNVDDIGIHEGAVEAAVETIVDGPAQSGSLMTVCGGTRAALELLTDHPDVPVGIHLTLVCDDPRWQWAPLTSGSSIQEQGLFLAHSRQDELLARATARDVSAEFRAQIEVALNAGLHPSHLDWHCLADGGRQDIFDLTLALADEYELGIRAWGEHGRQRLKASGRIPTDQPFLDSFAIPIEDKINYLLNQIRNLPVGLSEWAVHPAAPNPDDSGTDVRESDHQALMSPALQESIQDEGITVLGYSDLVRRTAQ